MRRAKWSIGSPSLSKANKDRRIISSKNLRGFGMFLSLYSPDPAIKVGSVIEVPKVNEEGNHFLRVLMVASGGNILHVEPWEPEQEDREDG